MVSEQAQWHNKVNIMKLENNMVSFRIIKKWATPGLFGACCSSGYIELSTKVS